MQRRHALSEERWSQIAPLLPSEVGRAGRPAKSNRLMLEGMVWVLLAMVTLATLLLWAL